MAEMDVAAQVAYWRDSALEDWVDTQKALCRVCPMKASYKIC